MTSRVAIAATAIAALTLSGCTDSPPADIPCTDSRECLPTEQCLGGFCVANEQPCGPGQRCPSGQRCCGGLCTTEQCCTIDTECPGGYCDGGRCVDTPRPSCSSSLPCPSGRCLLSAGRCVECLHADDCDGPSYICTALHTCAPAGSGCTHAACAAEGLICAPEQGGCRACIANSECGDRLCKGGTCAACSAGDDCGLGRSCVGGVCTFDEGIPCNTNDDCGELACVLVGSDMQCMPCLLPGDCSPGRTCTGSPGRCVADDPECDVDADCAPPREICQASLCVAGCVAGACPNGQECSATTGRCVIIATEGTDVGEPCTAHDDCLSNLCWPTLTEGSVWTTRCSRACVRHDDCPTDAICWELGDGNVCLPKSVAFAGTTIPPLSSEPGATCSGDFVDLSCRTGYCGTVNHVSTQPVCMQMCGDDDHCADVGSGTGLRCVSAWPVGQDTNEDGRLEGEELYGFTQLCHADWGSLEAGIACGTGVGGAALPSDHDRCESGWCVWTPDRTQGARCGQPCCTPSDCPVSASVCKPIDVYDGVRDAVDVALANAYGFQKVCLWREYQGGGKEVGELCATDSECNSEICAAGPSGVARCTHTCCTAADCANYDWAQTCRPPFGSDDPTAPLKDANFEALTRSLGRTRSDGGGIAWAATPLCMPE